MGEHGLNNRIIDNNEPDGIRAEQGMAEILGTFSSVFPKISRERTKFDDASVGTDMIATAEDGQIKAIIDVSSNPEKVKKKIAHLKTQPCVRLHSTNGKKSEEIPKIIIGYDLKEILRFQDDAQKQGNSIIDNIPKERLGQIRRNILESVSTQFSFISEYTSNPKYIDSVRQIMHQMEKEIQQLGE